MLSDLRYRLQRVAARAPMLLPSSCALCGADGRKAVCDGCHAQFFRVRSRHCRQCALPLPNGVDDGSICGACLQDPPAFDATIAAADYAPPIDQLVLALKFGGRLVLAPLFARMLRDAVLHTQHRSPNLPTLLVAVPLGKQRLIERGFNQAHEVAKPLSRALGIPLATGIVSRQRDTQAQALLHPDQRHENIRDAFTLQESTPGQIEGLHIGIVDDVMTTGQTLEELASTLKRHGAACVTNIVFARTLLK
jgi:ComF family protein